MRALVTGLVLWAALSGCSRKQERPAEAESSSSVSASTKADAPGAILFLSADLRGYLGPCGCSENMRGGIARAAAQLQEARKGALPVLYVDGGDGLFGSPTLKPDQVPQEERKARALAEAMKRMGLAVRAVGELDDTRGADFRRGLGLPELEAGGEKVLNAGARKVGVVSASDAAGLKQAAAKARAGGASFVVGLFHGTVEDAQRAAATPELGVDLVLATHTASEFDGEQNKLTRDAVPVVALQSKGRSLLRVDLAYGSKPGRFTLQKTAEDSEKEAASIDRRLELLDKEINLPGVDPQLKSLKQQKREELVARRQALLTAPVAATGDTDSFSLRFVPLESTLPSDPDAQAVVNAYDADVGKMNLEWAKAHGQDCPAPEKGQAAFVGSAACAECHAESFPVWEASKHHEAWKTLETVGKQFHLNCTGCHVTGWEKPGGVCRLDKVAGRESVGCESCHGPGSLHVADPSPDNITAKPGASVCVTCHNRENSPHFDFAAYVPKILGPGHGQPPAVKRGP
ncbi:multiheme c-type cytochrome [Vitiosangium sp. GDMCC 1.1324]|uniref:multiheme c-type cytochrome n=1 Tax=Vitiosangium sp. (strain GDMCC 1.1324) TaxID=2138576 RepID=UPI000D3ACA2C|nr:multiheme c-type cytochrome [Vitiosangium sp. GDMCC 1.1324]PTL78462.1 cytochrome C [Vitiosangium sp. GDMCC 1.1324]